MMGFLVLSELAALGCILIYNLLEFSKIKQSNPLKSLTVAVLDKTGSHEVRGSIPLSSTNKINKLANMPSTLIAGPA